MVDGTAINSTDMQTPTATISDQHRRASAHACDMALRPYFTDKVADTLMSQLGVTQRRRCSKLTNWEREVAAMVAEGYSNKEIAEALGIHLPTVETHRASAIRKLQLSASASSAGLVRYDVRNKLVEARRNCGDAAERF